MLGQVELGAQLRVSRAHFDELGERAGPVAAVGEGEPDPFQGLAGAQPAARVVLAAAQQEQFRTGVSRAEVRGCTTAIGQVARRSRLRLSEPSSVAGHTCRTRSPMTSRSWPTLACAKAATGLIVAVTLVGLASAGLASANVAGVPVLRPALRVLLGGALAMGVTALVGQLAHVSGI